MREVALLYFSSPISATVWARFLGLMLVTCFTMGAFHFSLLSFPARTTPAPPIRVLCSIILPRFSSPHSYPVCPLCNTLFSHAALKIFTSSLAFNNLTMMMYISMQFFKLIFREGERRRNISFRWFHLFMHSVDDFLMCPAVDQTCTPGLSG